MKTRFFSLIELLVVVAVIGILAGITFPALSMVKEKGKATQARSEMASIKMAALSFESDYSRLPGSDAELGNNGKEYLGCEENLVSSYKNYLRFFDTLTFSCYQGANKDMKSSSDVSETLYGSTTTEKAQHPRKLNPKGRAYLEPTKNYYADSKSNSFRDPWKRPYVIFLDTDYDGKINSTNLTDLTKSGSTAGETAIRQRIAIVSFGTDDDNKTDRKIFSWK